MNDTDFDNFRETHGGKCSVRLAGGVLILDGIIGEIDDSVEILLGGGQAQTQFSLRLKRSELRLAGIPHVRALLKKPIYISDEANGVENERFVVLSARAHPASAIVHLIIREA